MMTVFICPELEPINLPETLKVPYSTYMISHGYYMKPSGTLRTGDIQTLNIAVVSEEKYSHTNGRTNEWDDGTDKYNTRERYNYINRDDIRYHDRSKQNETGRNYYSYDQLRDTRMHHNDWEDDNYQRQPNYHYRSNYYQRRHY